MDRIAGISLLVSGITFTIISVERDNALLRPMEARLKLNRKPTKITIRLTWALSVAIVLPLIITERKIQEHRACTLDWNTAAHLAYWACLDTKVGISLVILFFCYIWISKLLTQGK